VDTGSQSTEAVDLLAEGSAGSVDEAKVTDSRDPTGDMDLEESSAGTRPEN